jgi:hypothetical protein
MGESREPRYQFYDNIWKVKNLETKPIAVSRNLEDVNRLQS